MERRPWYERMLDRDNPAGPIIVLLLLVLAIGLVLMLGPMLDRMISGDRPSSYAPRPTPVVLAWPAASPNHPA